MGNQKPSHGIINEGKRIINLPMGFRFSPTDQELVVHYLRRKVFSLPLPASIIPDHLDVFHANPWVLPGDMREKRYFFSKRKGSTGDKYNSICNTGSGYWKSVGKEKQILAAESNKVIGVKKLLVFHQGKWPHGSRTRWVMHEYRLVGSWTIPHSKQRSLPGKQDWVVCCITLKKTNAREYMMRSNRSGRMKMIVPSFTDFIMMEDSIDELVPPQPNSPSCSASGITEISFDESNDEADSPSYDSYTKKQ